MTQWIRHEGDLRTKPSVDGPGNWDLTLRGVCTLGRDGLKQAPDLAILRARRRGRTGITEVGPVLISLSEFPSIDVVTLIDLLEHAFSDRRLPGSTRGSENGFIEVSETGGTEPMPEQTG